ncbi:hypothetical protein PG988_003819 [Apiospora saccharicola]
MESADRGNISANSSARRQKSVHDKPHKEGDVIDDDDDNNAKKSLPTILDDIATVAAHHNDRPKAKQNWRELIEHYRSKNRQDSPQLFPGWVYNVLTNRGLKKDELNWFLQLALDINLATFPKIDAKAKHLQQHTGIEAICFLAVYFGKWVLKSKEGCEWLEAALRKREQDNPNQTNFERFSELFLTIVEDFKKRVKGSTATQSEKAEMDRYDGVAEDFRKRMKPVDMSASLVASLGLSIPPGRGYRDKLTETLKKMGLLDPSSNVGRKKEKPIMENVDVDIEAPDGHDVADSDSDSDSNSDSDSDSNMESWSGYDAGSDPDTEIGEARDNNADDDVEVARSNNAELLDEPSLSPVTEEESLFVCQESELPDTPDIDPVLIKLSPASITKMVENKRVFDASGPDPDTPTPSPSKRQKMNQEKKQLEKTPVPEVDDGVKTEPSTPNAEHPRNFKFWTRTPSLDWKTRHTDWENGVELISSQDAEKLEKGRCLDSAYYLTRPSVEYMVCPLKAGDNHWVCLYWNVASKTVAVYDPSVGPVAKQKVQNLCEQVARERNHGEWGISYKTCPKGSEEYDCGISCIAVLWLLAMGRDAPDNIDTDVWRFFLLSFAQRKTAADLEECFISQPSYPTTKEVGDLADSYEVISSEANESTGWDAERELQKVHKSLALKHRAAVELCKDRARLASARVAKLKQVYSVVTEANRNEPKGFYESRLERTETNIRLEETKISNECFEDYTEEEKQKSLASSHDMLKKHKSIRQHDMRAIETYNRTRSVFANIMKDEIVESAEEHVRTCTGWVDGAIEKGKRHSSQFRDILA